MGPIWGEHDLLRGSRVLFADLVCYRCGRRIAPKERFLGGYADELCARPGGVDVITSLRATRDFDSHNVVQLYSNYLATHKK